MTKDLRVSGMVALYPRSGAGNIDFDMLISEIKRLKGVSNGGYHNLGAARVMSPTGKAFAEEMAKLQGIEGLRKQ